MLGHLTPLVHPQTMLADVLLIEHKVASAQHRPVCFDVLCIHELAELGELQEFLWMPLNLQLEHVLDTFTTVVGPVGAASCDVVMKNGTNLPACTAVCQKSYNKTAASATQ